MTLSIPEHSTKEDSRSCSGVETENNTEHVNNTSDTLKSRCTTYLVYSIYLYLWTAVMSFAFLVLLFLTVVILISPRYDSTISIASGRLTHLKEETKIVTSTKLIEWDRSKVQPKSGSHRDTIQTSFRRCDHSPTSSLVPLENYGYSCPKLDKAPSQPLQTATMCSISDIQVCPLVQQNLSLDHGGSSNKTASRSQEVARCSVASLRLQNATLSTSVAEVLEVLQRNLVYYVYLLILIARNVFNASTAALLLLLLMPTILFIFYTSATNISESECVTNGSLPSDSPATAQFSLEPLEYENNDLSANETTSESFQSEESNVPEVSTEGKRDILLAQSALEEQQFVPSELGPLETKTVHDCSKDYDQWWINLMQQPTTPPQDRAEVASTHSSPSESSRLSTDGSTDVQVEEESFTSEVETDSEDDDDSICETSISCTGDGELTDLVGLQKLYIFDPVKKLKGRIHDNDESTTTMEQPFQPSPFYQHHGIEEDPIGLQTKDQNTQPMQERMKPAEGTTIVSGSLPIGGGVLTTS